MGDEELDYWLEARQVGDEAQIMVPFEKREFIADYLSKGELEIDVMIENVEMFLKEQQLKNEAAVKSQANFNYNAFNTYDNIMDEMEVMKSKCKNDLGIFCDTYTIGDSTEGRDMKILYMYKNEPNRQAFWMDSQIHAREWLAVATNLKIADHLISNYGTDTEATMMMDDGDWYFLFVHNPDGYVYSHTSERFWRKNRGINAGTSCVGVDLNRNFEEKWGGQGASTNPCSQTYRGASPASEVETQNVQAEILSLRGTLKAFNTIHTAARLILMPWGTYAPGTSSCEYLPAAEQADVDRVAKAMASSIASTYGYTTWRGGNSCDTIYPAAGLTQDYGYEFGKAKYSFTPELRDRGQDGVRYGFAPPPSEIEPSFREMWNGFVTMVREINAIAQGK